MDEQSFLWTEKYRPSKFKDIQGQKEIIQRVSSLVASKNIPHLMFAGPAGVGKSTLALATAKELFGDSFRQNFLELNASDERGIDIVRVKVKDFARTKSIGDVPFKIIFLDECDALTRDAQQALRRTMETYAQTARFILSCNYISKIIDPIQSRCVVFKFKPLEKSDIENIVAKIVEKEGLTIKDGVIDALLKVSEGDCRRIENILQSCASTSKEISTEALFSMAAMANPEELTQVLTLALSGDFNRARSLMTDVKLKYGMSGLDVIKQLQHEIWGVKDLTGRQKVSLIEKCGDIEFRLTEGSDETVQLESFLASVALVKQ